jgi:hypothetical protein
MKYFLLLIIFWNVPVAFAVECQWWQSKVSSHQVNAHQRNGSTVSSHPRQEHCREKWKHSDKIASSFQNARPELWTDQEKFKQWTQSEIVEVLKAYEKLPDWLLFLQKTFHRAEKSTIPKNPAASDKRTDSITVYDEFYNRQNKVAIIGHELAHLLYKRLSVSEITSFTDLAGWTLKVEGSKVFEVPPPIVLINDSNLNKEEDFANLIEVYFTDPNKLKNHNFKLFEFFKKRYP